MWRLLFLLAGLVAVHSSAAAQPVLRFATRSDVRMFEPLIAAVYAELGYKVEYELLPAERGLLSADEGLLAGDIGRNVAGDGDILKPYPNLMLVSEPLFVSYDIAYALKGKKAIIAGIADLANYRVGIVRGSKEAEDFVKRYAINIVVLENREVLDQMLRSGRIDVAIGSSVVTPPDDMVVVNGRLRRLEAYHILNRKYASLALDVERVIKAMKADGRWAALLRRP